MCHVLMLPSVKVQNNSSDGEVCMIDGCADVRAEDRRAAHRASRRTAVNSPDCEELGRNNRQVRRKPKKHGAAVGVIVVPGSYLL